MKYLITDPCYVVPKDEWSDFLDMCDGEIYGGFVNSDNENGYRIEGFGTIIESSPTQYGDGHIKVGKGKEVMADAGLTCMVRLDEGVTPTNYQGTAVTAREDTARRWYELAKQM